MRPLIEGFLDKMTQVFPLRELPAREFSSASVGPMKFSIRHWDGGLLGNVSYMSASGMMGLMKMETLIVNPTEADLPLLSMDTILAMGKFTAIAELYDTTVNGYDQKWCLEAKQSLVSYPDGPVKNSWYDDIKMGCSFCKKTGKADVGAIVKGMETFLDAYLASAQKVGPIRDAKVHETKLRSSAAYVDGLLKNGGPSTDVFIKKYGREKTERLYREVLFGKQ